MRTAQTPVSGAVLSVRADGAGRSGRYRERAEQVAPWAVRLVTDALRTDIEPVRILITNSAGLARAVERADRDLAAGGDPDARPRLSAWDSATESLGAGRTLGQVAVDRRGILLVLNAGIHRGMKDFDATVVHEFVHCAQFSVAAVRESHRRYLRQKYNLEPRGEEYRRYWREADQRESEAIGLETLSRKLPSLGDGDDREE